MKMFIGLFVLCWVLLFANAAEDERDVTLGYVIGTGVTAFIITAFGTWLFS